MKRFQFRLQVVLDRAVEEEERELRLLGERRQALARAEAALQAGVEARRQLSLQVTALQEQPTLDAQEVHQGYLYLDALAKQILELETLRQQADDAVAAQRHGPGPDGLHVVSFGAAPPGRGRRFER